VAATEIIIRRYRPDLPGDRNAMLRIFRDTGLLGGPVARYFPDPDFLADAMLSYYLRFEPEWALVAETKADAIGVGGEDRTAHDHDGGSSGIAPERAGDALSSELDLLAPTGWSMNYAEANDPLAGWSLIQSGEAQAELGLDDAYPLNPHSPHAGKLSVKQVKSGTAGLMNEGFWGIPVNAGEDRKSVV